MKRAGGIAVTPSRVLPCSPALKKLTAMVGRSAPIYRGVVELCAVRLRDSEAPYLGVKEAAYCSLRSQLLMALHDGGANEITSKVGGPGCTGAGGAWRGKAGALSGSTCRTPLLLLTQWKLR